jgi:hypothetical protein
VGFGAKKLHIYYYNSTTGSFILHLGNENIQQIKNGTMP